MNIAVLLKQTFDTEEKIVLDQGVISNQGVKYVINPYDEYAVEEALKQKEQHGGQVTVISVGQARTIEALRTALAMGADEAVLIESENNRYDEYQLSNLLHHYIKSQPFDLILAGNFSIDSGGGQVAIRLATLLRIPHVSSIVKLKLQNGVAEVLRDVEGDIEEIEVSLPALFTAQQGLNEPRYPTLPGIMKAKKKPLHTIKAVELNLTEEELEPTTISHTISLPPQRAAGKIVQGTIEDQVRELVSIVHAARRNQ